MITIQGRQHRELPGNTAQQKSFESPAAAASDDESVGMLQIGDVDKGLDPLPR